MVNGDFFYFRRTEAGIAMCSPKLKSVIIGSNGQQVAILGLKIVFRLSFKKTNYYRLYDSIFIFLNLCSMPFNLLMKLFLRIFSMLYKAILKIIILSNLKKGGGGRPSASPHEFPLAGAVLKNKKYVKVLDRSNSR